MIATRARRAGWNVLPAAASILGLVLVAVPAAEPTGSATQAPQRSIVASIVDRTGAPVSGLTAADLIVREDGVAREVIRVSPAPPPGAVALLVDDSQAAASVIPEIRQALTTFVDALADLSPTPAIRLTTFGDRPTVLVDYIPSFPAVSRAIDRIVPRSGAGSTLLEAIVETSRDLQKRDLTRPIVVAFVVEAGPEFSTLPHTQVAQALQRAGASLWTVALSPSDADILSENNRERAVVLGDVTRQSGGSHRVVLVGQEIPRAFETLARTLMSRYEITYGRPDRLIPPSRIEVTARDTSLRVSTTSWAAP